MNEDRVVDAVTAALIGQLQVGMTVRVKRPPKPDHINSPGWIEPYMNDLVGTEQTITAVHDRALWVRLGCSEMYWFHNSWLELTF